MAERYDLDVVIFKEQAVVQHPFSNKTYPVLGARPGWCLQSFQHSISVHGYNTSDECRQKFAAMVWFRVRNNVRAGLYPLDRLGKGGYGGGGLEEEYDTLLVAISDEGFVNVTWIGDRAGNGKSSDNGS